MPDLSEVIKEAIEARLLSMNTAIPAKVTKVDVVAGKVDVQPVLKKKYADGTVVDIPIITNVPLATYRAGDAFVSLPVKPGHFVLLIFSQRSMDKWLAQGGTVDPQDPRRFSLNDAVAYPGVYPFSSPATGADSNDIIVKNGSGEFRVKPDGKFKITNGEDEVIDLCIQLIQAIQDARTNTIFGPQPLINVLGKFDEIKSKLQGLKG